MLDNIKPNTILIVPDIIKERVIRNIRDRYGLIDVKFMNIKEFRNKYFFSYDNKTIYYLMDKYLWKYEVCLTYLEQLYYIEDKEYSHKLLSFLVSLRNELDDNNLLIYNKIFRNSLSNKNIIVYGFDYLDKYYLDMFNSLSNVSIIDKEYSNNRNNIYEFKTMEEEVNFVCISILDLINKGIDINKIKLANVSSEYYNTLLRLFNYYNIPLCLDKKTSLYETAIGKYFLDNYDNNIEELLDNIKSKYKDNNDEYNMLISILNNYTWCDDYLSIKDMIIYDLKHTYIKEDIIEKRIECVDILNNIIEEDNYIFLMNFNQGSIPVIKKDEDYITDSMKEEVECLDSTITYNKKMKDILSKCILNIKNLYITYKLGGDNGSYTISSLNEILEFPIINNFIDNYNYSNIYNKLRLSNYLDEYEKYDVIDDNLPKLYSHYLDIEYKKYDNKFTGIDSNKLKEFINNKLTLSYTTINDYYRCSFRYFLNNILRLNIYEESFVTIIGNIFHYILSNCFEIDNYDIDKKYHEYIEELDKDFSNKELFFLDKLKEELKFIINTIKEQLEYCELDNSFYEKEIYIDKSRDIKISFMGKIDRIIYDDIEDKTIVSIIDYKTGKPNINISNTIYGLEMQLPIYVYLIKKSGEFSSVQIAGFYLQQLLNNEIAKDNNKSYEKMKKDNLKLQGYSNEDINILKYFDSSYMDSNFIKSLKVSSKGFYAYSKVISNDKIDNLVEIVDEKIDSAIDNILDGKFDINPKRIGNINCGCEYCKFRDICFMNEEDIVNLSPDKELSFLGGDNDDSN